MRQQDPVGTDPVVPLVPVVPVVPEVPDVPDVPLVPLVPEVPVVTTHAPTVPPNVVQHTGSSFTVSNPAPRSMQQS